MPKRRQVEVFDNSSDDESDTGSLREHSERTPPDAKRARRDESLEQDSDDSDDGISESELERMHEQAINTQLEGSRGKAGGVADMGIIQRIDLVNFLCHKYLTVHLGPQINFIIGHNGSGKSAVLTGIAVALGGKATSTGRGTGLKSFIKEGETASEVTIRIKNEGPDAFEPKTYGKSIIVTRHFNISGSSGYKIKSSLNPGKNGEGRVVTTTKAELSRITDHMNIQVDNPLNVLTQDLSRKFISNSSPAEKYEFFLKGTQLQQLSEEYQIILENIQKTSAVLKNKREAIPDLKAAYKQAVDKYKKAKELVQQQDRLDELTRELAWAHVSEKEMAFEKQLEVVSDVNRHAEKIEKKMSDAQAKLDELNEKIGTAEEDTKNLDQSKAPLKDALAAKISDQYAKSKALETEKSELNRESKKLDNQRRTAKQELKRYEDQIRAEEEKMKHHNDGSRAKLAEDISRLKAEREAARAGMEEAGNQIKEKETRKQDEETNLKNVETEFNESNTKRDRLANIKAALEKRLADKWSAYGTNISQVIDQVNRQRWNGPKPLGPIGDYVELRDSNWSVPVKVAVGSLMSGWIVQDADDRNMLKDILMHFRNPNVPIIVNKMDNFDFSAGEPHPDIPTVRRVLEIRDAHVERTLVNVAHIEAICLARTRLDAENLHKLHPGQLRTVYTCDLLSVIKFREGGGNTQRLDDPSKHFSALFTGSEAQTRHELQRIVNELDVLRSNLFTMNDTKNNLNGVIRQLNMELNELFARKEGLRRSMNEKDRHFQDLEHQAKVTAPAEIGVLQEAKEEAEAQINQVDANIASTRERLREIDSEIAPITAQIDTYRKESEQLDEDVNSKKDEITTLAIDRAQATTALKGWGPKLDEALKRKSSTQEHLDVLEQELRDWTKRATEKFSPKIERTRTSEQLNRERERIQRSMATQERALGASADELSIEVVRSKEVWDKARADYKDLDVLNLSLNNALKVRMRKWARFRRHISIRSKLLFQNHLANRGFFGKIILQHPDDDHPFGTLHLKIRTDDQIVEGNNVAREKDTKGLSGGEKSFSTLCLLMSLWDAIGCPIRCLDEFDVFMDEVNRVVAMSMMVEAARSTDGRQFILITPLGTKGVKQTPEVKIHKMNDPQRNQMTLDAHLT